MRTAFAADHASEFTEALRAELRRELADRGHEVLPESDGSGLPDDVDVVFNVTSAEAPRANYLRARASSFVCTLAEAGSAPDGEPELRKAAYRVLVQTMSNLLVYAAPGEDASWMLTPELGCTRVPHGSAHAKRIADKVTAIADVRYVIDNELVPDLPVELHDGDDVVRSLREVGRRLDALGLLPSVLPLEEILSERERRVLMKVFGVKQLSYGNLSARHDAEAFWMTGRGVDKGRLGAVGRDVLLVTGIDEEAGRVRVSVPRGTDETVRVSVDAVEHALIYRELPDVGAILHVHAWVPGIPSTRQSYPCGSFELAREVRDLVLSAPDPSNAVVGLVNHGITATGPDIETLFERLDGRLERRVPMT